MNLIELYEKTPVERHKDIKVAGGKVFVKNIDGNVDEYLITPTEDGQELWLVRSDKEFIKKVKRV